VVALNLLQSLEILSSAGNLLANKAIVGFTVRTENIKTALERNPILVTALNPTIGYELGAKTAKRAYKEGRPVKEVALETTKLSAKELDRLLDPLRLTRGGIIDKDETS
jgi:fumarate hydratase class II